MADNQCEGNETPTSNGLGMSDSKASEHLLRQYTEMLERARVTNSRDPVLNRYPWQCEAALNQLSILAAGLQDESKKSGASDNVVIRIRTDSLPMRIYGGVVADRISSFLNSGGMLRILVTKGKVSGLSAIDRFQNHTNVEVRQEDDSLEFRNHFFVVDKSAYRYESPHDLFSGKEFDDGNDFTPAVPARVCFRDNDGASHLADIFDVIWGASASK